MKKRVYMKKSLKIKKIPSGVRAQKGNSTRVRNQKISKTPTRRHKHQPECIPPCEGRSIPGGIPENTPTATPGGINQPECIPASILTAIPGETPNSMSENTLTGTLKSMSENTLGGIKPLVVRAQRRRCYTTKESRRYHD